MAHQQAQILGRIVCGVLLFAALAVMQGAPAHAQAAQHYCDPSIRAGMMSDYQRQWQAYNQRVDTYWQAPNSFGAMFCGTQLNSSFDSILNGVGLGTQGNMINGLLNSLLSKVCQQTVAMMPTSPANMFAQACQIPNNQLTQQNLTTTSLLDYYLKLIAKVDPAYLKKIYSDPNYSTCLLLQMIIAWLKLHPEYILPSGLPS